MKNTRTKYCLVGYDKDNDLYEVIDCDENSVVMIGLGKAAKIIQHLPQCCYRSKETNEPFDWFVVCEESFAKYPIESECLWTSLRSDWLWYTQ